MSCSTPPTRSRWAAIGAAVAVTVGGGGLLTTSASVGSGERGVFVPITPCRLMDTRPGGDNVGPRNTPLGTAETYATAVRGTNGNCTIPIDAIGVSMNVTIINPTASSYLTVFPADATRPLAANLNWVAGQAPTPNAVTADLSADGRLAFFNLTGSVDLAADINGYYVDHTHDDRYDTKAQLAAPTDGPGGIGILERVDNSQLARQRWDQDPARPGTVAVGQQPNGVLFDGRWIWTANRASNNVSKIDPRTNTVVSTVGTAADPARLAFDGHSVWVTSTASNTVTLIDPGTATASATFGVAGGPGAIAFDGTNIWIALEGSGQLAKIDPATHQVLASYTVGAGPSDVVFDGTNVWTADFAGHSLTRVNVATGVTTPVPFDVLTPPRGLAFDGQRVWFTQVGADQMQAIDPVSLAISDPVPLPGSGGPFYPVWDGSRIWVPNCFDDSITVVNTLTLTSVTIASAGQCPLEGVFDGTNVWFTMRDDGTAAKLPAHR